MKTTSTNVGSSTGRSTALVLAWLTVMQQLSPLLVVHSYRIPTPLLLSTSASSRSSCCRRTVTAAQYDDSSSATQQHHPQHHHIHRLFQSNGNNEFDYLLGEGNEYYDRSHSNSDMQVATRSRQQTQQQQQQHRRIVLPSSDATGRPLVVLASSSSTFAGAAASSINMYDDNKEETGSSVATSQEVGEAATYDPYANALDNQFNKIEQYKDQQTTNTLESKFKSMDLQDIVLTLLIPGVLTFVAGRFLFQKVSTKVSANTDAILDSFASEMIYHDGDYKEMELCYKDYSTKLVYMGPLKSDAMIKRFLALYSKKKTVSPQAIVSLSYVFTIFQLSEEKAASILVQLCNDMGTSKISSIGKLLFLGTRILKSDAAIQKLQSIKTLIMSTYRDERVAVSLVETSQQAIAEAAYRTAVLAAGKNQQNLSAGWEVLGLSFEAATRIWEIEKKENFTSDRETMYGGQTRKYDRAGRQVKDDGKLVNPEEATPDDDSNNSSGGDGGGTGATSNVYECGNCGFTLFVATGRESKFFGDTFKCPECGAAKTEFNARDDTGDE